MIIVRTTQAMRELSRSWHRAGETLGFVPTMGYLHDGHLSLVKAAAEATDRVVVSIFVNPTQFGPDEDLDNYPRDFERDEALCREAGVAAVFYPESATMYAADHSTWVVEERLTETLCGAARPGHFRGVTTVVAKLFHIVEPDVAVFGRKDAQQALVIQRMVRDLDFAVRVVVAPLVREQDGLAMSSRNKYLSPDERRRALSISRGLEQAKHRYEQGERDAKAICDAVAGGIAEAGGRIDYVAMMARADLRPVERADGPVVLAVATYVGRTRLIDNVFLG
ncbi:MAG: pantoate--beta-alanine ligase [Victivallales bacterium]|jgi:pantoate--beta-alanine ligase|nr:pantoate--beta-alanine ligase [Victivallales bacterium]